MLGGRSVAGEPLRTERNYLALVEKSLSQVRTGACGMQIQPASPAKATKKCNIIATNYSNSTKNAAAEANYTTSEVNILRGSKHPLVGGGKSVKPLFSRRMEMVRQAAEVWKVQPTKLKRSRKGPSSIVPILGEYLVGWRLGRI